MKTTELREKSIEELKQEELNALKELFKLNMQKGSQQLNQTHLLKATKRNIARIKTVMTEKLKQGN